MRLYRKLLAALGLAVLTTTLTLAVPLFLRMPPWCDLTLYDVAAHNVIAGGTLFEDVFDTNLPGFVWCLIGIRRVFGPGVEVVRAIDLAVVTVIVLLLSRWCRRCGVDAAGRVWLGCATALFYPFTTEFSHCQRDVWMMLPILCAVMLRLRRISAGLPFRRTQPLIEGIVWGMAVWFKPHVMIVAGLVWLSTRKTLRQRYSAEPRVARRDFAWCMLGGALVGLLGIAALISTGTWKPFVIVFTKWNTNYILTIWGDTLAALERFPVMFPPWSLLHFLAIPMAIWNLVRMLRARCFADLHFCRGTLAALYLAVLFQACFLQRNFDYVHVPEMLLAFAVVTLHWKSGLFLVCTGLLLSTGLSIIAEQRGWHDLKHLCVRHRLALPRTRLWSDCFTPGLADRDYRQRQQKLALSHEYFSSLNMVELGEVAEFLQNDGVQTGDVIAWHDTPHALYLDLGIQPTFRFMHISTVLISEENFARMTIELRKKALPKARYIVTDLMHAMRYCTAKQLAVRHEAGWDLLPPSFTAKIKAAFPYDQPAVFRSGGGSGRYIVHRIVSREPTLFEQHIDDWD